MSVCSKFSPFYTTIINVVFWTTSLIPALFTIWAVQDKKTFAQPELSSSENNVTGEMEGEEKQEASTKA
jgi:hypothetical protein